VISKARRRALAVRLLLSALFEFARGCFHALRFEHDRLGRGFECGDALGETGLGVHSASIGNRSSRSALDALMAKVLRAFPALKPGCVETGFEDRMGFTCAFGFIGTLHRGDDLRFWRSNASWCEVANRWLRINSLPAQVRVWTLYAAAIAAGDVLYAFSDIYAHEGSLGLLSGEGSGSRRASNAWVRTLHADLRPPTAEAPCIGGDQVQRHQGCDLLVQMGRAIRQLGANARAARITSGICDPFCGRQLLQMKRHRQ
jgi:hypothetical protein